MRPGGQSRGVPSLSGDTVPVAGPPDCGHPIPMPLSLRWAVWPVLALALAACSSLPSADADGPLDAAPPDAALMARVAALAQGAPPLDPLLRQANAHLAGRLPPDAVLAAWPVCRFEVSTGALPTGGPPTGGCAAPDAAAARAVAGVLRQPLSADAAVMVALLRAPALQVIYADLGLSQADLVQAGLLANPVFTLDAPFSLDGRGPLRLGGGLVGDFLDLLWRGERLGVAARQRDAVVLAVAAAVGDHAAAVRAAYWRYRAALALVDLATTALDAAQAADTVMADLRAAGNMSERTRLATALALADAQSDLDAAQADSAEARQDLARLMGLAGEFEAGAEGRWSVPADMPPPVAPLASLDGVRARMRADNPTLRAARAAAWAQAAALDLADRQRLFPGASAGVAVGRDRDQGWGVGPQIALPLPLFDQGQGRVSAAVARYRQLAAQAATLTGSLDAQITAQWARQDRARRQALRALDITIPARDRVLALTVREYNQMLQGPFDVLAAKTAELAARRQAVLALRDYWLAGVEVARLAGPLAPDAAASPQNSSSGDAR